MRSRHARQAVAAGTDAARESGRARQVVVGRGGGGGDGGARQMLIHRPEVADLPMATPAS
jgi:hypothetical protein